MTEETKPKEEKAENVQEVQSAKKKKEPPAEKKSQSPPPPPPPVKERTQIGARLTAAVEVKPLRNRSSDLVPLSRDFEIMRHRLRTLISATKEYRDAMRLRDQTRSEVIKQIAVLSENSPIFDEIGQASNSNSLVALDKVASQQTKLNADNYQKAVIDYVIEWERVTTSRVDASWEETQALHATLNHYEEKVDVLRKKVHTLDTMDKTVPPQLEEKVERNEEKLKIAWTNYENSARALCNLLEEVTKQGWKDLYPMVKALMEYEAERAVNDYDVIARIPITLDTLEEIVQEEEKKEISELPKTQVLHETESDTSGSYHDSEGGKEDASKPVDSLEETLQEVGQEDIVESQEQEEEQQHEAIWDTLESDHETEEEHEEATEPTGNLSTIKPATTDFEDAPKSPTGVIEEEEEA